jgi:hypothetical protein
MLRVIASARANVLGGGGLPSSRGAVPATRGEAPHSGQVERGATGAPHRRQVTVAPLSEFVDGSPSLCEG